MAEQIYKNPEVVEGFLERMQQIQEYLSEHMKTLSKEEGFAFFLISTIQDGKDTYDLTEMVGGKVGTMVRRLVAYMGENPEIAEVLALSVQTYMKICEKSREELSNQQMQS